MKAFASMTGALLFSVTVQAQNFMHTPVPCVSGQELAGTLLEYRELPLFSMINSRQVLGQFRDFPSYLFANIETGTWTLVDKVSEDVYCVIAMGSDLSRQDYAGTDTGQ